MNKVCKFIKNYKYWILGLLIVLLGITLFIIFKGRINFFENTITGVPATSGVGEASSGSVVGQ